jgi:hypothetical protein
MRIISRKKSEGKLILHRKIFFESGCSALPERIDLPYKKQKRWISDLMAFIFQKGGTMSANLNAPKYRIIC